MKMLKWVVSCLVLAFCLNASAYSIVQYGGEIPWPLSVQHVVTVSNSQGLWKLQNKSMSKVFNVEMRTEENGLDWIRVSELHPKTYEVISWGEGYFNLKVDTASGQSSFSNILVDTNESLNDRYGRYISMYPNGDLYAHPYMIRIVEVESTLGNVLGLSIINYVEMSYEHLLGARIMKDPLACHQNRENEDNLTCFMIYSPF